MVTIVAGLHEPSFEASVATDPHLTLPYARAAQSGVVAINSRDELITIAKSSLMSAQYMCDHPRALESLLQFIADNDLIGDLAQTWSKAIAAIIRVRAPADVKHICIELIISLPSIDPCDCGARTYIMSFAARKIIFDAMSDDRATDYAWLRATLIPSLRATDAHYM
jgi:hypothetical protein